MPLESAPALHLIPQASSRGGSCRLGRLMKAVRSTASNVAPLGEMSPPRRGRMATEGVKTAPSHPWQHSPQRAAHRKAASLPTAPPPGAKGSSSSCFNSLSMLCLAVPRAAHHIQRYRMPAPTLAVLRGNVAQLSRATR